MIVYLDLVFFLNFFFDFILLLAVKIILKRNISWIRLGLGALFGSLSIFLLFLKINNLELFCFKLLISMFMLLITFGFKNIRYYFKNFLTLYIVSAILGGFLYFLNNSFAYKKEGLVFFHKGLSINIIFLVLISPVIIYIYIKEHKILVNEISNYYNLKIIFANDYCLNITGYLDTGNNLKDPISNKKIILVNSKLITGKVKIRSPIYVPFKSLNNQGLVECLKPKAVYINKEKFNDILIGLSKEEFHMEGIDCLLNNQLKERLQCLEN